MSLIMEFEREFQKLRQSRLSQSADLTVTDSFATELEIEFSLIESLSCSIIRIGIYVPKLANSPLRVLQDWAAALSLRVTYLMEGISPIEIDPVTQQVLVRSTKPSTSAAGLEYYEMQFSQSADGTFEMRRYHATTGQAGRTPVEMQVTNQILSRLVKDIIETIPDQP